MRIALLSVLLLNTVCGDSDDSYGCIGGWFEFQCKYEKQDESYLEVSTPNKGPIRSNKNIRDVWKQVESHRSLYHNTTGTYWRVHIKQLDRRDFGEYECNEEFTGKIELEDDDVRVCPERSEMAYTGASTTINCTHPGVNFICKESPETCITLNGTNPVYHISNVSVQDQGVYWCGDKSVNRDNKVSKEKIHLQVVEVSKRSITPGQRLIHRCKYITANIKKLVFKGEDPTTSPIIVSTSNKFNGSFTLREFKINQTVILIIQRVTIKHSGSYWFGSERTERGIKYIFFHKLELTVGQLTTSPSPTHPDAFWIILIIAAVVCVVLLLLVLIACVIHRRVRSFAKTIKPNKEEHFYEEIQERPPQPGSGTALKTIYAIATFPVVSSKPGVTHNKSKIFKDNVLYSVAK